MGSGCGNNTPNNSSFQYNFNQSNCTSCNTSNCSPNASDVSYTGPATCLSIPANSKLDAIIQLLASAICAGGEPNPDYSGYNVYCLAPVTTQQSFVEKISQYVCTLRTDFNNFETSTGDNFTLVNDAIDAINNPALTSCVSIGIQNTDNLHTVLSKIITSICAINLNPSGANWNQCYTVSPLPTTIVAGFNSVIDMICQLKAQVASGVVLPIFDNTSSCLPAPVTSTDSLVTTINKIKQKLCSVAVVDIDSLNFDCVSSSTDLQGVIQNILSYVSSLQRNSILAVDTTYFTLSAIDPENSCAGKKLTLNTGSIDRLVASNNADTTPGTLIEKLQAGTGITLDDSTIPGKVIITNTNTSGDVKVKTSVSDPTSDYLMDKIEGGSDIGIAINITEDTSTNPSSYKAKLSPAVDWDALSAQILTTIQNSETLQTMFCQLVGGCASGCEAPAGLIVSRSSTNFSLNWTAPLIGQYETVQYRDKGTSTWLTAPGVTPSNPMITGTSSATIGGLLTNTIYEFRVENTCVDGTTLAGGIYEYILFECLSGEEITVSSTQTTITIDFNPTSIDINAYYIILKDGLGNTVATGSTTDTVFTFTGLTPNTLYNISYYFDAVVNGVHVFSNDAGQLGMDCSTSSITTAPSEQYFKVNVLNTRESSISINLNLTQTTPSLTIYNNATLTLTPSSPFTITPVLVTSTLHPLIGNVGFTNNSGTDTITFDMRVKTNGGGPVPLSTGSTGSLLPGQVWTNPFGAWTWGNSPDDYVFTLVIS